MSRRINVVLPEKTVALLDRFARKGDRSRLIDHAVRRLVEAEGKANLRQQLKEEAETNGERDLAIAAEWFALEEEAAQLRGSARSRKITRKRRS